MRHCFLCSGDFSDDTRMVIVRGGSNICVPCSETERGKRESADAAYENRYGGYRPGFGTKGEGLRRSLAREQWKALHGTNTPMPPKAKR